MIDIMYKTANDIDFPLIFRLDAQAFNRPFDTAFKNVEELKKLLKGTTIEIAYDQKTPIGYYSHTHTTGNEIEIIGIVVIPRYQRQGVGTNMLMRILNKMQNKNRIKIVTHPKNIAAINLYKKFGFQITKVDPEYYGKNELRVIMYKTQ